MLALRNLISELERKKTKFENELEYMTDGMTKEEGHMFSSEIEKLKKKICVYEEEIQHAKKTVERLEELTREIQRKEDEWDRSSCYYQGANSTKSQELRNEINNLESEFSEVYNELYFRIKDL